ncbi:MAG: 23S rRNA (pseudouridine(1915)-N(3))-methyltransferase RlmH [Oscillospiraceae bacterium]|nr:23S rRNA (pseudouridine(1915)-N(3))-methyltransferase RlmH [Oscillospiraceae bacterium]
MVSVKLICVGKMKEKFYIQAAEEYAKRLSAYCRLEIIELPEERLPDRPSAAEIERALDAEKLAIVRKTPPGSYVTAMCIEGKELSSTELAAMFKALMNAGESSLVFIIGGSNGLSEDLKKRAGLRLSMSPMTFPHHLARVMLLEQIYRAFKINEGSAYHK